jgi:hypothetical protein
MGENTLALRVDRPGIRRGEVVKLAVPVSYRIGADVTPMSDPRPQILIRAQAIVGSDITIDGKHVPLDGDGTGTYVLDETDAAEGPADESKLLAVDVPYVIVPKGAAPAAAERGTVSARVPISPLRVDSPRGRLVTEDDHIVLAGRAPKGATVKIDSAPVVSSPDGAFEATLPLAVDTDRTIEVRASTATLSPRTVHVQVKRVASLAQESRALDARPALGYDAAMADLSRAVGQPMIVAGEVVESRGSVMLIDDRRGCAKGPCATRVVLAQDVTVNPGTIVRAYGRVARPFTTPMGQAVPEVEAAFVLRAKR